MRDYQTKSNQGGLPDSISATRLGGGEFNSIAVELENAVTSSDQTLAPADGTGEVTEQLANAMAIYGGGGADYMIDTGAANAYVLNPVSPKNAAPDYFDGMLITFLPGNVNTGASTVNVNSIGLKDIEFIGGIALSGGELATDSYVQARYNSSADRFELVSIGKYQLQLNKNLIINGNFDIWQRNTTQTSSGFDSDDRWHNSHVGSSKTHSRQAFTIGQTAVPLNPVYYSSTVVVSSAGASNYVSKHQPIENVSRLSGATLTLSFYAKASASMDIAVDLFQYFGTGGSPSAQVGGIGAQKFSLTTAWQLFESTITLPSISGKTLGSNGDDSTNLRFWFDAGSDFDSLTDTLGQQSGTFDLSEIQIEFGSVKTRFEILPLSEIYERCQRYYFKSGSYGIFFSGNVTSGQKYYATFSFPTTMRTTPTIVFTNLGVSNFAATPGTQVGTDPHIVGEERTANGTGAGFFATSFTADAEL